MAPELCELLNGSRPEGLWFHNVRQGYQSTTRQVNEIAVEIPSGSYPAGSWMIQPVPGLSNLRIRSANSTK
jgi:hypothetical protein